MTEDQGLSPFLFLNIRSSCSSRAVANLVKMSATFWPRTKIIKLRYLPKKPSHKKLNLEQKINHSKPHNWSWSFSFRFSSKKSQNQQDHSFYNTVSLKKPHSFYEPQLTHHCKKYTPAAHPKNLIHVTIFHQNVYVWSQKKTFALHHF